MVYKYSEHENYEDLSSGRVIYGASGSPNFPVRLGNEIYRRCVSYLPTGNCHTVYDPCCGGGYLLTVLGFCNSDIARLFGSDIREDMVSVAARNLALLTREGLDRRKWELEELVKRYNKPSHLEALDSAKRLLAGFSQNVESTVFSADCTDTLSLVDAPDIIITDVPYGNLAVWGGNAGDSLHAMYAQLYKIAHKDTILAVIMDKKQKYAGDIWIRLERQTIGKRKFEIYRKAIWQ